ncbi:MULTISPECIES: sodium:solute symporter family protein [Cereibacter]|uniref:Cation/acetate symporter n=1 Tax=Cereibacter johrii TaxID=445629 RepID=A0ABX5J9I3_9RHOB|nr:sodium:solute symporter family protein [Cereibacter johrii]EKX59566.1 Acetate permease ActP (cation/acetate symporter) [Rhodobacter sp. AKP1]RDS97459.1 cation acetate symporter [Cereibacter sphaeroides f. sp. denitrificans]MEA5160053.1 sodium:solute symporter family protein [Cereibacter johrii]ODM45065.1 cation acetate symporter [Cereibacter johrii]PTM79044.1 cation/acetate symporter [Cereibacter johrii]
MDQFTLNLIVVGITFAIYVGIAIWARAGSTAEFYAAGQGVHPVMNGMATGADWMSAASFISMAGIIALAPAGGYTQSAFLMGWTGGYVLLALLLAPYLRKFGKFTVPEFIGDRFYSGGARLLAVVCLIIISITYVIGQMRGVGVTFSRFLEVSTDMGLYIGAAIVFAYAVFGGMKGITYTQVAQYVVLIIAYTIPAIFISLALTGAFLPQLGLIGDYAPAGGDQAFLAKLDQVVTELGFTAYTADTPSMLNMFLFTMSLMIGTAGLPHVIIRFFTVPKVADARSSAGWALVFIALLYTVAPAVGSMARLNFTTTMWPGAVTGNALDQDAVSLDAIQNDPKLSWVRTWEQTGLLVLQDLNGDGKIQYFNDAKLAAENKAVEGATKALADARAANADAARITELEAALAAANEARIAKGAEVTVGGQTLAERGWVANEVVKVDNDIMVLANPEIAALPGWVIALVAAGALAAALSTAAGLLLAISSAISHDLIKGSINPNISEKGELLAARISMTFAIVISTWLGLNPPGFAAQVVALAFGLAAATIFPALMMGIFSKRVNKEGAILGMLVGLVFTSVYIFLYKGWFFIPGTEVYADVPANYFFGISPLSIGTIGAILNFAVAFAVSAVTKAPPRQVVELVESIRIPRGAGKATAH